MTEPTYEELLRALRLVQHKVAQVLAGQTAQARLEVALHESARVLRNWDENVVGAGHAGHLTPRELLPPGSVPPPLDPEA
jgi:hypothetical protein